MGCSAADTELPKPTGLSAGLMGSMGAGWGQLCRLCSVPGMGSAALGVLGEGPVVRAPESINST